MMKYYINALFVILFYSVSFAQTSEQPPLVGDRPDYTESSEIIPLRMIQIESGYTFSRSGALKEHTAGEMLFRIPLAKKFEARVGLNSFMISEQNSITDKGIADILLGGKVKLYEGSEEFNLFKPHIAILAATTLPTGSKEFTEDKFQPEIKTAFAWDVSENLTISSNLNYFLPYMIDSRESIYSVSLSLGFTLNDHTGFYSEYYNFFGNADVIKTDHFLNSGFTFLVNNDLQFDIRIGINTKDTSDNYYFGTGIIKRINFEK